MRGWSLGSLRMRRRGLGEAEASSVVGLRSWEQSPKVRALNSQLWETHAYPYDFLEVYLFIKYVS